MITSKEIVNLETKINALLFNFRMLKKTQKGRRSAYFREVKSMSRSIYTLMHKLEMEGKIGDRLKNR